MTDKWTNKWTDRTSTYRLDPRKGSSKKKISKRIRSMVKKAIIHHLNLHNRWKKGGKKIPPTSFLTCLDCGHVGNVVAIHDHDINDDVNMAQSGAHLVGEILPRSGGRTGSPSIVSWKATILIKQENWTGNVKKILSFFNIPCICLFVFLFLIYIFLFFKFLFILPDFFCLISFSYYYNS